MGDLANGHPGGPDLSPHFRPDVIATPGAGTGAILDRPVPQVSRPSTADTPPNRPPTAAQQEYPANSGRHGVVLDAPRAVGPVMTPWPSWTDNNLRGESGTLDDLNCSCPPPPSHA